MLAWEYENPPLWVVHHLLVLCYHLQHPTFYSPAGLADAQQLLAEFVAHSVTPAEIRQRKGAALDSGRRTWKITATSTAYGVYRHPVRWPLTAATVIAGGVDGYCANVRAWAASIYAVLQATGNLEQV